MSETYRDKIGAGRYDSQRGAYVHMKIRAAAVVNGVRDDRSKDIRAAGQLDGGIGSVHHQITAGAPGDIEPVGSRVVDLKVIRNLGGIGQAAATQVYRNSDTAARDIQGYLPCWTDLQYRVADESNAIDVVNSRGQCQG